MSAKIVFSEITWSTYRSLIISAFFNRFIAWNSPVFLFLQSMTLPKLPVPSVVVRSKSLNSTFLDDAIIII